LDNSSIIVPFAPNLFKNNASANFIHTLSLPDVRIVAAEFLVTNAFGPSQATQESFAYLNPDDSLRTLSGGQFSLQVNGYLATQQNAAPPLLVEASHAIRDIRATVNQASNGYDVVIQVLQNSTQVANLTIPAGALISSNIVKGANLPPLMEGALLTINVALNLSTSNTKTAVSPGRDLTVTIRL
jgi:hypothetical protein